MVTACAHARMPMCMLRTLDHAHIRHVPKEVNGLTSNKWPDNAHSHMNPIAPNEWPRICHTQYVETGAGGIDKWAAGQMSMGRLARRPPCSVDMHAHSHASHTQSSNGRLVPNRELLDTSRWTRFSCSDHSVGSVPVGRMSWFVHRTSPKYCQ